MNEEIIKAYSSVFKNYKLVNKNEFIAKESIQDTMLKMLVSINMGLIEKIRRPRRFIISASRYKAKSIVRDSGRDGKLFYDSETPKLKESEDGSSISMYDYLIDSEDLGQLHSIDDKESLDRVKEIVGEEYEFILDHLDFSDGSRLRGAKNEPHRPKVFESDKERYRMAYLRKKIKKKFNGRKSQ